MNWTIEDAVPGDAEAAGVCMADAFSGDPHMAFFFPVGPVEHRRLVTEFFTILAGARIALGMPVKVLKLQGTLRGVVMGYTTAQPAWPDDWQKRWARLEAGCDGLAGRLEATEAICNTYKPSSPHYYLGVLGLHPSLHGLGAGAALIRDYCSISDADPASSGTFLETCSPKNVPFYRRMGFEVQSEERLDARTTIWCLFRPKPDLRYPSG